MMDGEMRSKLILVALKNTEKNKIRCKESADGQHPIPKRSTDVLLR